MITAIFPAAGQGRRMEAGINKVFLELCGKPILVHTLLAFSRCPAIDDLIVVVAPEEVGFIKKILCAIPGLKPYQVVAGGAERQYSVYNGLAHVSTETELVLVHDAARPLVPQSVIEAVAAEAAKSGAAIAAVPVKDTIKVVNEDKEVLQTPSRSSLWMIQTPQGFRRDLLVQAYQKAQLDVFVGTDDASLVERLGASVKVVKSDYRNIKLTTPEDILIAEAFLRSEVSEMVKTLPSAISSAVHDIKHKIFKQR